MNHRKILQIIVIVITVIQSISCFAVPIDTGLVRRIQPGGIEFMGREWGDEFGMQGETKDGFKFFI